MEKENTTKMAEDQNPDGANFDAKAMLVENGKNKTVIKFKDRVEVELIKDTLYQKKGKIYSPHRVKAEALVVQKIAKYTK